MSISGRGNDLIVNIGSSSFYALIISMLFYILAFAQKEYESGVMEEIGEIVEIIRPIAYEHKITLNTPFECTKIDQKENWIDPEDNETRSYFIRKREKSSEENYSGIWIVDNGKNQTAYYWKTENKVNHAFKLGTKKEEIQKNFKKAEEKKQRVENYKDISNL